MTLKIRRRKKMIRFPHKRLMFQAMFHTRSSTLSLKLQILIILKWIRDHVSNSDGSSNWKYHRKSEWRSRSRENIVNSCFISKIESKNVKEAFSNEFLINVMQEELFQIERNKVWELVPRPEDVNVIGTKWVFKSKSDENGNVTRN